MTTPIAKREIFQHQTRVQGAKDGGPTLRIFAIGERGPGGDNHAYHIEGVDAEENPALADLVELSEQQDESLDGHVIIFQHGPSAYGWNGITIEALLAIAHDRLSGCQTGPFACPENANAMAAISLALGHLHQRAWNRATKVN